MTRNPAIRMQTPEALMSHPFYKKIRWDKLKLKKLESPVNMSPEVLLGESTSSILTTPPIDLFQSSYYSSHTARAQKRACLFHCSVRVRVSELLGQLGDWMGRVR